MKILDIEKLTAALQIIVCTAQEGRTTNTEAVNEIVAQLTAFLNPVQGLGDDMMALMTKMAQVRLVQKKYFAGDRSVIRKAKALEEECDQLMTRLCKKYNILIKESSERPEQKPLF